MQLTNTQWIAGGAVLAAVLVYLSKLTIDNTGLGNEFMKTSQAGIQAIEEHEGLRLNRYKDSAGLWTIGYGHLIKPDESLVTITASYAEMLLVQDLATAEDRVKKYLTNPVSQSKFDSLVSLTFNIGVAAFRNSDGSDTRLKKALDAGDDAAAAAAMQLFNKAGGKVNSGLVARRASEAEAFLA